MKILARFSAWLRRWFHRTPLVEFRFRFLGWHDEEARKSNKGSINYWEERAQFERVAPSVRESETGIIRVSYPGPDLADTTPAGTILTVVCFAHAKGAHPKRIVEFFDASGMRIEYLPGSEKRIS